MKGEKFNFKIEKHKKNKIKAEKKQKPVILDFKVRFNILTFLTYACRNYYFNKTFLVTNCKSEQNIERFLIQNFLAKQRLQRQEEVS